MEILKFQVQSADCVIGELLLSVQFLLISSTVKLQAGHVSVSSTTKDFQTVYEWLNLTQLGGGVAPETIHYIDLTL